MIRYVVGDATQPQSDGSRVIVHICNDIGAWGKGFVLALSRRWPQLEQRYRAWARGSELHDPRFALGAVQFVQVERGLWVANCIGQHDVRWHKGVPPVRYPAIAQALGTVAQFAEQHRTAIHMPRIGCGLAGGTWERIEPIIAQQLAGCDVTVYDLY